MVMVADATIITLAIHCEASSSTGNTVAVAINGQDDATCKINTVASNQSAGTQNGMDWMACDLDIDAGDGLGFEIVTSNGTATDCRMMAGLKYR